ncbi:polysaccharide deacetylase family sporulation protein PdaB [Clostridium sp. LBM24168]
MKSRTLIKLSITCICIFIGALFFLFTSHRSVGVFITGGRELPIYHVNTDEKKIAITFDVSLGNEEHTQEILEILDKYKIKATFFVVGDWVDKYPDMLKKLSEKGHEIGNHSNRHPNMTMLSTDKALEDININEAKIRRTTGNGTKLFRCPAGAYNNSVINTVKNAGYYCIQWDVDSVDWMEKGSDVEYKRIIKNTKSGSILLFHNSARYTPGNLPKIIEKLQSQGYKFVTVGDLIYKDNYSIDNYGNQIAN